MHCHTTRSDGSDSPEYVIRFAKQLGLSALAITDHDSYAGDYDAEGLGRSLGMRVINGVECSTYDHTRGHKVHILCYNIKHRDAVDELFSRVTKNRADATLAMLEKVAKLYPITEEMVMEGVSESDSWHSRKQAAIDRLARASRDAKIVAMGDKLSNARIIYRDFVQKGDELWKIFHVTDIKEHEWHYRGLAASLKELEGTFAYAEFTDLIEKIFGGRK